MFIFPFAHRRQTNVYYQMKSFLCVFSVLNRELKWKVTKKKREKKIVCGAKPTHSKYPLTQADDQIKIEEEEDEK